MYYMYQDQTENDFIKHRMGMVYSCLKNKIMPYSPYYDDSVSAGCWGLLKCYRIYDSTKNVPIDILAYKYVKYYISVFLRDNFFLKQKSFENNMTYLSTLENTDKYMAEEKIYDDNLDIDMFFSILSEKERDILLLKYSDFNEKYPEISYNKYKRIRNNIRDKIRKSFE